MRQQRTESTAPRSRYPWLPEDDRRLKELSEAGETDAVIGKKLGRSRRSIVGRRQRLGIDKPLDDWTEDELAVLREEYASHQPGSRLTSRRVAQRTGRSSDAVRSQAYRMGLSSPEGGSA